MTEIIKLGNQQGVAKHKRCLELGPFCKVVFALSTCMMALTLKGSFTIFTGPRCLWGPVYGSRSLYVCTSLHTGALVETLLM